VDELDSVTIELASRGDARAFRRLYDHYAPFVWRLAYRMCQGDQQVAAQITQDVFVRTHRGLRSFDSRSRLSTWLYRVTYNQGMSVLSHRSKWRRRAVPMLEEPPAPTGGDRAEARDLVNHLLRSLTPDERFLLVAREVDGVPFEELARITGRSAGSLRTQVSRMKNALREEAERVN